MGQHVRRSTSPWPLTLKVTLTFVLWPWIWGALLHVEWTTFLPIVVYLGRFVLDLSSDASRDLATLIIDLEGHGACRWCRSSWFTVWALIGLVTLTFDLLTSKWVHWLPVWWASILPKLGFLDLSILQLCWGTPQTDGQTTEGNL